MRSRSGAIHSQSQQEFIKIALASSNTTGIFYDQKINRTLMASVKLNSTKQHTLDNKKQQKQFNKNNNIFSGFDFQIEKEGVAQERMQLKKTTKINCTNIGIISHFPHIYLTQTMNLLGLQINYINDKVLDLIVKQNENNLTKYWIFNKQLMDNHLGLLDLYLSRCSQIYDLRDNQCQFEKEIRQNKLLEAAILLD